MNAKSAVLTEQLDDVLVVTLNRPDRLNALTPDMLLELTDVWSRAADDTIRAVVVTGAGRGFCAGADLAPPGGQSAIQRGLRHTFNPHIVAMTSLDTPVIAAINGSVAGAGLAIALGADIRVAVSGAKFVPAFAAIGLVPDSGVTYLAPRVIGSARSFDWLASGRAVDSAEALAWGMVTEVVPDDELLPRALEIARTLAAQPGEAVALTKRALGAASRRLLLEQLELEAELQERAVRAPGRAAARARVIQQLQTAHDSNNDEEAHR